MSTLFKPGRCAVIGVIHLRPLPGSPRWSGEMRSICKRAVEDALAFERGGAGAVIIENYGDVPFTKGQVPPETVAAMAFAASEIREAIRLPFGFNVLRNDPRAALSLCSSGGGSFIRVNVHCGAMLTDQGIIEGTAFETLRLRSRLCPDTRIFADVHVKHAVPLAPWSLEDAARDTAERGLADALIVSGAGTGLPADPMDAAAVRKACPSTPVLIGSGITESNAAEFKPHADGVIVGTSVKKGGQVNEPVDARRVERLVRRLSISNT